MSPPRPTSSRPRTQGSDTEQPGLIATRGRAWARGFTRALMALWLAWATLPGSIGSVHAGVARLAVDSSFARPLDRIAEGFEAETGHHLRVVSADSGRLRAQILQGARFDLLVAADRATVDRLQAEGQVAPHSRVPFATGRLVLWSPDPRFIDHGGAILRHRLIDHVALASPEASAYGAAAHEALRRLDLLPLLQGKLLQAQSLEQAFGFVAGGSADLGFLALAQVFEVHRLVKGSAWLLPADLYEPIVHEAVVLSPGQHNPVARAFMDYLRRGDVQAYLRSCGYEPSMKNPE